MAGGIDAVAGVGAGGGIDGSSGMPGTRALPVDADVASGGEQGAIDEAVVGFMGQFTMMQFNEGKKLVEKTFKDTEKQIQESQSEE